MHRQASEAQSTLAQAHGTSSKGRCCFYPWERRTTEPANSIELARCKMSYHLVSQESCSMGAVPAAGGRDRPFIPRSLEAVEEQGSSRPSPRRCPHLAWEGRAHRARLDGRGRGNYPSGLSRWGTDRNHGSVAPAGVAEHSTARLYDWTPSQHLDSRSERYQLLPCHDQPS